MKSLAALLLGLPLLCQTTRVQVTQPFSYQTDTLGLTKFEDFTAQLDATQKDRLSFIPECLSPKNGTRMCYVEHYLNGPSSFLTFVDDTLAQIDMSFPADDLNGFVTGLRTKFGKPEVSSETYHNDYGAARVGRVWVWKNKRNQVVLKEIDSKPRSSHLTYADVHLVDEYAKRNTAKPIL